LASGQCTNLIDVGSVTNTALGGLTTNVFYYFTVVAHDAAGDQAVPSNQIQYMATNATVGVTPPSITTDLTNQNVIAGSGVSFQIGASGAAPLGYQWLCNGVGVPGATANILTLNSVTPSQAGPYQVIVTNSAGAATSSVATLTVLVPPTITADLVNQTVADGSNATFQVGVAGTGPLSYQWLFNGANVPGATSNPLALKNVALQQAGTYQVMVSNSVGAVASSIASLSVLVPPSIVVNLTNQSVPAGSNVIFQVTVTGSAPLAYQWLFNGTALSGATSNVLNLAKVGLSQAGSYRVIVSNALGSATSAVATLNVIGPSTLRIAPLAGGSFKLTFIGEPSQRYQIQSSTSLTAPWQVLGTVKADASGLVQYTALANGATRFFRMVLQ
jgi:hypothetical protein